MRVMWEGNTGSVYRGRIAGPPHGSGEGRSQCGELGGNRGVGRVGARVNDSFTVDTPPRRWLGGEDVAKARDHCGAGVSSLRTCRTRLSRYASSGDAPSAGPTGTGHSRCRARPTSGAKLRHYRRSSTSHDGGRCEIGMDGFPSCLHLSLTGVATRRRSSRFLVRMDHATWCR